MDWWTLEFWQVVAVVGLCVGSMLLLAGFGKMMTREPDDDAE